MPFGRNIQMAISLSTYKIDTFCIKRRLSYFYYFSYNGTIKKFLREHKGSFPHGLCAEKAYEEANRTGAEFHFTAFVGK